jgi:nicotinamide riboside kinase
MRYRATLLLAPDLPWMADGIQRDGPAVREACHALLRQRLLDAGLPFVLVEGLGDRRLQTAAAALRDLYSTPTLGVPHKSAALSGRGGSSGEAAGWNG